jgi:CDGSH-type Zn-finger protein
MNEQPSVPHCHSTSPARLTLEPKKYAYCTCGLSADGVFCDGAHRNTQLRPMIFEVTEHPETVTLCRCKQTANRPFCDGSHSQCAL